jgi:beta-lactamase class C
MTRKSKIWIALAVLALVGWLTAYVLINQKNLPIILKDIAPEFSKRIASWQGRIDYSTLDTELTALSKRPEMAGLAVAVVEDGELRFVRTYGVTDRSTGAPVTPETVFRWASVSKTATGALASSLASDGKLDLNRPISSWQTSLRLPKGNETRVTVAQLLTQQTGITHHAYDDKLEADQPPGMIRAAMAAVPMQCRPGTCHTYQNVAFDAASEILAQAAGKPFDAAVGERFFHLLGMVSANYGMAGLTGASSWARPHHLGEVRTVKEAYWRVPAAAGVSSNIGDFAKWMQAMMGVRPDVVSAPVLQLAQSPRVATPRLYSGALAAAISDQRYGLGWRSFTYEGRRLVGHSGAVAGYRATMIFEPTTRTGVVAMWNSNWGIPFRIPFAVFDSYHKRKDTARWLDLSDVPLPVPDVVPPFPQE